MHSTHKAVYLAHANMHTNNLLAHSDCYYCKQGVTGIGNGSGNKTQERELAKLLLYIRFITSEVHRTV